MSRVSGKPYSVYVLWSRRCGRFYIGISENPHKRVEQHNHSGRGWTARYAPWNLVYEEIFPDYTTARKRELDLKAQKGGAAFFVKTGLDRALFVRHGS